MNPFDYLETLNLNQSDGFRQSLAQLEEAIRFSSGANIEEAVPAEMMAVFSDEQWPELLFAFQPSLRLLSSEYDLIGFRQQLLKGEKPGVPQKQRRQDILIYRDDEGLVMRAALAPENVALRLAVERNSFSVVAGRVWPELQDEEQQHKMTEQVIAWLHGGLIIDVGVPIPEDAEFETEEQATR